MSWHPYAKQYIGFAHSSFVSFSLAYSHVVTITSLWNLVDVTIPHWSYMWQPGVLVKWILWNKPPALTQACWCLSSSSSSPSSLFWSPQVVDPHYNTIITCRECLVTHRCNDGLNLHVYRQQTVIFAGASSSHDSVVGGHLGMLTLCCWFSHVSEISRNGKEYY